MAENLTKKTLLELLIVLLMSFEMNSAASQRKIQDPTLYPVRRGDGRDGRKPLRSIPKCERGDTDGP
ncbi:MAG: hypothetical protein ACE14P_06230 [Methanotrichaceae archaeon]